MKKHLEWNQVLLWKKLIKLKNYMREFSRKIGNLQVKKKFRKFTEGIDSSVNVNKMYLKLCGY